jgi:hypothetical protein
LNRIESNAFSSSLLESIEIPQNFQFIDGSAFCGTRCNHVSIEASHKQLTMRNDFLIDFVNHRLIRNFSSSSTIIISSDIEILGSSCFSSCKSLSSISFESNSRLNRIESNAFSSSSLKSISIPRNVEILGSSCFSDCKSLSSISFESNSRLNRIESEVFRGSSLESISIPQNVQFIACNASLSPFQISLAHVHSCPEYGRWQRLRCLGIQVDFRQIRRSDSGLSSRSDCFFNFFGFHEGSQLNANERLLTHKSQKYDNGFAIIVKPISDDIAHCQRRIENLMNLRHPCISSTIGVVLRSPLQELQIVREYSSGGSLSEVISTSPEWWTPTAKVKAIVGIVLSLRFAHSFGLLHGHLTGDNVVFDDERLIQICDFCENNL